MKPKVLHITNWYPERKNPGKGIFIFEHVNALDGLCDNRVLAIDVQKGNSLLSIHKEKVKYGVSYIAKTNLFKYYRIQKWIYFSLLFWNLIFKRKARKMDVINYHIAVPMASFHSFFRKFINTPVIITEHWSAYHTNFGLPENHKGLEPFRKMFRDKDKAFITVSKSLGEDIKSFSRVKDFGYHIVPNVVNTDIFNYREEVKPEKQFFMVTNWRRIKRPRTMIQGFHEFIKTNKDFKLVIGGEGELIPEMKELVSQLGMDQQVVFKGFIAKKEIAYEMNKSRAFLHNSSYETFSLVCAEALCCGCPLIINDLAPVKSYTNESDYCLVKEESAEAWNNKMAAFINTKPDRKSISKRYKNKFSVEQVAGKYFDVIKKVLGEN